MVAWIEVNDCVNCQPSELVQKDLNEINELAHPYKWPRFGYKVVTPSRLQLFCDAYEPLHVAL